jgi:Family of unknown function (DUF5723)
MRMKQLSTLIVLTLIGFSALAQTETTQYFMSSLPQYSVNNPAFMPKYKFSLGLPGISSISSTYTNNGFSYNDLITKSGGEVKADMSKWSSALTQKNYITQTMQVDLLRFGIKVSPKLYFQLNSTVKEYARFLIPKELSSVLVQGTAPFVGQRLSFSPRADAMAYIETALGAAYQATEKLTVGIRVKYLKGLASAMTESSAMTINTTDNYEITAAADLNVKTSGIYDMTQSGYAFNKQFKNYMTNSGYGIDLGATYKLTDRISLAASVIDLGQITWKNNLYAYTLDKAKATYTFSGIDADKLIQGNTAYLDGQSDSIQAKFTLQKKQTGSYSTPLPGKVYISGTYELVKNLNAGVLIFNEKFQGRFSQGVSMSVNKHFGKWASTSVSYTMSNRSYNNFGAGLSLNLAPVQIYIVGDNLLNAPISLIGTGHMNNYINNTQVFSLRFGLNFVWGWDRGKGFVTEKKTLNKEGGPKKKEKVTSASPGYLKVRKKRR